MEEIINQIISNRNYHMLSDKQVGALKELLEENNGLKTQNNQLLYATRKNYKIR